MVTINPEWLSACLFISLVASPSPSRASFALLLHHASPFCLPFLFVQVFSQYSRSSWRYPERAPPFLSIVRVMAFHDARKTLLEIRPIGLISLQRELYFWEWFVTKTSVCICDKNWSDSHNVILQRNCNKNNVYIRVAWNLFRKNFFSLKRK